MANILLGDGKFLSATGDGSDAVPYLLDTGLVVESVEATNVGITSLPKATTATLSSAASSASTGTLLASNADRVGVLVSNDSSAILYLKYGATASTSSYSVRIAANTNWEMPQPIYTGIIDGIWASANGNAYITELE